MRDDAPPGEVIIQCLHEAAHAPKASQSQQGIEASASGERPAIWCKSAAPSGMIRRCFLFSLKMDTPRSRTLSPERTRLAVPDLNIGLPRPPHSSASGSTARARQLRRQPSQCPGRTPDRFGIGIAPTESGCPAGRVAAATSWRRTDGVWIVLAPPHTHPPPEPAGSSARSKRAGEVVGIFLERSPVRRLQVKVAAAAERREDGVVADFRVTKQRGADLLQASRGSPRTFTWSSPGRGTPPSRRLAE